MSVYAKTFKVEDKINKLKSFLMLLEKYKKSVKLFGIRLKI